MAELSLREVPITRDQVHAWIEDWWAQPSVRPSRRQWLRQRIQGLNVDPDDTIPDQLEGAQRRNLADAILDDWTSYKPSNAQ